MVDGDVTNAVLAERLAILDRNQSEDFADIKRQLSLLVSRELYDAHRAVTESRLIMLEKALEELRQLRQADVQRAADTHKNTIRWVLGAIFAALLTFIGNLYIQRTGGVK